MKLNEVDSKVTCKDCIFYKNSICSSRRIELPEDSEFCNQFCGIDGKRPRFCELANSKKEMARALVIKSSFGRGYSVSVLEQSWYENYSDALRAAKAWLNEVE